MKKYLIGTAIGALALVSVAPVANAAGHIEGNAYGVKTMTCLDKSVGEAIQNGRDAHMGAKMTAKTIAMSPHCAS